MANDKLLTKQALARAGLPLAETLAVLHRQREVGALHRQLVAHGGGFVTKPAQGAGGRGITLFNRALADACLLHGGPRWSLQDFGYYICRILQGEFTVGRPIDAVLVEEKLEPDTDWILPGLSGAPDLRIIIHQGHAVLMMARLPTQGSQGKANLHQGGVGVGIDPATGRTTHAIWHERTIEYHPDSGELLTGREVEGFAECVKIAVACARAIPLGYMGVDLIRDRRRGPCVLEVNARPGLAIQLANRCGLGAALARRTAHASQHADRQPNSPKATEAP